MRHGFHGGEEDFRFGKRPSLAVDELGHGFVVEDEDGVLEDLGWEVEVAGFPSDEGGVAGVFERDAEDFFWLLADDVVAAVLVENHAVVTEPGIEVEAEFRAVVRNSTPTTLEKKASLGGKDDLAMGWELGFFREHALDEVHLQVMNGNHAIVLGG